MRPTRRGYGLVAVVVAAEVLAWTYGARAINAVAAPAVVALVAAAVRVRRSDPPTVDRASVPPGFPGDTREVSVAVDGSGVARLAESLPEGVTADDPTERATLPAEFAYEVTLGTRGRHALGPLEVRVTDVLGLVRTTYDTAETTSVLVYPPVYLLAGREQFLRRVVDRDATERQEFDSLRKYTPGDPLRDVHWKSTAKDPEEMYVTEFADRRADDTVVIAASAEAGYADGMAAGAASVAVMALEADVAVELRLPSTTIPAGSGVDHRDRLLRALALADAGTVAGPTEDVDLHVHADAEGITLTVGSRDHSLDDLTVSRTNPLSDREVAA